jgi:hypothetical protein
MGHLLSSAIKMQGAAATTATLILQLVDATSMNWTKNGVSQGSITGTQTFTLNAGDTFLVTSTDTFGSSLNYLLNGSFVTSYFGIPTATSPTLTAAAGNTYRFEGYSGA